MLILVMLAVVQAADPNEAEIIVTARRRKCDVAIANRLISDREFKARAVEWARGTPVRVVAPRQADIKCLAKITFRLADRGVRVIHFADPPRPIVK